MNIYNIHHPKLVGNTENHQIGNLKLMEDKLDFIFLRQEMFQVSISHFI